MKNSLISILITNYNKEKFLEKCLKSIKRQNYKNYEVILFDDCSSDNSIKIIKKFPKIKIIRNKKRSNISYALNQINGILKAFKKSRGDLICLMDSDDFFRKDKLKIINREFKNQSISSLYNFPDTKKIQFVYKKKNSDTVWPTIFPTSCITITKNSFKIFEKYIQKSKYLNLEIDARLIIFFKFYFNEYNILSQKLTTYNFAYNSITSKIRKFSIRWWQRRFEAFQYLKYILSERKKKFKITPDYLITTFFVFIIKIIKL